MKLPHKFQSYVYTQITENKNSDTGIPVFMVALFTVAKRWKQPKCTLTDEWINKMWYIYISWYISWSQISFSHKKEYHSDTCYQVDEPWRHHAKLKKPVTRWQILYDSTYITWIGKFMGTQNRVELTKSQGKGYVELLGYRVSVLSSENILELDVVNNVIQQSYTALWTYLVTQKQSKR